MPVQRICATQGARAVLSMQWSSGPVEDRINHIKRIKRQRYGRASAIYPDRPLRGRSREHRARRFLRERWPACGGGLENAPLQVTGTRNP
jgi:hypothetical protein